MTDKDKLNPENGQQSNPEEQTSTETAEVQAAGGEPVETAAENTAPTVETAAHGSETAAAATAAGAPAKKNASRAWMAVSLVLAVLLIVVLIQPPFQNGNGAVATVNGDKINKDDLYNKLVEAGGPQTLDTMITDKLVSQELDKTGITITQADLDKEFAKIKASFPSEEEFNQTLTSYSMTVDDLKKTLPAQVKLTKLLEKKVTVTDDDVKKYYETNQAAYNTEEQVRASHILVASKEEADAIKKQLEDGADFAQLAQEKSLDPGSKDQGGDLNFFPRGVMEKSFEEAAFTQKKDELGIVQTINGFHVLKVTDHKDAEKATLDEKKTEIKDQLVSQKVGEMSTSYLADLKSKAKITNTLAKDEPAAGGTVTDPATAPAAQ
jgi:foldase protein PrsA